MFATLISFRGGFSVDAAERLAIRVSTESPRADNAFLLRDPAPRRNPRFASGTPRYGLSALGDQGRDKDTVALIPCSWRRSRREQLDAESLDIDDDNSARFEWAAQAGARRDRPRLGAALCGSC